MPQAKTESAKKKCHTGWVCLYSGKNFTGRMLRFSGEYAVDLTKYGFGKKTSSWKNKTSDTAFLDGFGPKLRLKPGASDGNMGRFDNWATVLYP
ncbi:peptidase inhibitor family I36 protein [Streptomyces sp. NPDC041068]|uniref:peptidase inhibitor family I36 protein n=1 Tax=Streptomyces sp. NPDC041068 TaxID=3155130 RepID=UPI003405ACF8